MVMWEASTNACENLDGPLRRRRQTTSSDLHRPVRRVLSTKLTRSLDSDQLTSG